MKPSLNLLRLPALVTFVALAACNGPRTEPDTDAAPPAAEDAATPTATAPSPAPSSTPPPGAPIPPPAADQLARFDGYGDVRLGMTVEEARAAWAGELKGPSDTTGCYYLNPVSNPTQAYFAFMIDEGRFVRYDVGNDREVAPGGGKRGMTQAEITALYGDRVQASPHKYSDGKYLRVKDTAGSGVLVFETDAAGKVTEWHVGLPPQVDYVEGCS